jgi:hypothetical protein
VPGLTAVPVARDPPLSGASCNGGNMEKTETTLARRHFFTHRTGYAADLGKEENRLGRGEVDTPHGSSRHAPSGAIS